MNIRLLFIFLFSASFVQSQTVPTIEEGEVNKNEIVEFPDQQAEFPGGIDALLQFIVTNMKYPQDALENKIQGKVYLRCIINEKGIVTEANVTKGVSPSLDAESRRIALSMPAWIPAKEDDQNVSSIMLIPIIFHLK